jgi:uncharacterized protein (DUF2235 family)
MRNLVVCCDGTWNTPDQKQGGLPCPTNVVKIFNACEESDQQIKYYHPGVGTEGSKFKRMVAGSIGIGLDQNIQSAYNWLCGHYHTGDRIFLFGFSRGAYTVRSLSGFIQRCGLLKLDDQENPNKFWKRIEIAYREGYRKREDKEVWGKEWTTLMDEEGNPPDIHFIGVWDTVGARGVPDEMVLADILIDDPANYRFHDTSLSPRVHHAYHAVALDEMRASFAPTLWTVEKERPENTTYEQLWFVGNHCDVGGGHVECGLSDIALQWMSEKAAKYGLCLNQKLLKQLRPDSKSVLHDGIDGIWKLLRTLPRAVPLICQGNVSKALLHDSVLDRYNDPPISQAPYRATTHLLKEQSWSGDIFALEHWNYTGVWLEKGMTYQFNAQGEWIDSSNRSGPEGIDDRKFHLGEMVYRAGDLIARMEDWYRDLTGKMETDWWGTKRYENGSKWFELIGMVANQHDVDGSGTPPLGEFFTIGHATAFTPKESGYLYCFANDAWSFYDNNRGSVSLKITRNT